MKKSNIKNIIIHSILYSFLISIILLVFLLKFNFKSEYKPPIFYKVLDVINYYKETDGIVFISLKVQINEHQYEMRRTSVHNNITYIHYKDCEYCKKNNINSNNLFSFTILDGANLNLFSKIEKMKNKNH